jgi:tRNA(Ile)-lysidine synthase
MARSKPDSLPLITTHFRPGMRVGVAVSGGADSVALLRALHARWQELGLALTVLHVHHGIRAHEADDDAVFVARLAEQLQLRFLRHDVDTPARAELKRESMEEAARNLRYAWFESMLAERELDAVATAHTLDDQAETVLLKLLRGSWTEGLAGIFPVLERPGGLILRPFLETRRSEIESWLQKHNQPWRTDSTNAESAYTRNRIRHNLLPVLAEYNPQVIYQLAHTATIARDEEAYWTKQLDLILPSLLLPGRAVRGGGRASSTHPDEDSVGMEVEKLRSLSAAMRRRTLRAAAERIGCALNFDQTELLMAMCVDKSGRRETLTSEIHAERTPRELRLVRTGRKETKLPEYQVPVPGEVVAEAFGFRLIANIAADPGPNMVPAVLRTSKPGDRVHLRYSTGQKRMKEVLERLKIASDERKNWPVLEWQGEIVWIKGAEVESRAAISAGLVIRTHDLS